MKSFHIAIVGAGVIGQTLAITLARLGLSILLIEQRPLSDRMPTQEEAWLDRCVALNLESQQILKECGINWDVFGDFCQNYSKMEIWDAYSIAKIHFSAAELYLKSLGCILPTNALIAALTTCMKSYPNIHILSPQRIKNYHLNEDSVTLSCEEADYVVQLVVAADGSRSHLRELFGFQIQTWEYQQAAVVATVQVQHGDSACAYQQFYGQEGPIALLPLPKLGWYSLVWSTTLMHATQLCALEKTAFASALKQATTEFFGDITCLTDPIQYPLRMHHTKKYFLNRCVLIGDCAHSVHPLAGLGMNLGLKDVKVLADSLSLAKQQQRNLADETLLRRYHQNRYAEVWETIAFLEIIKRGFSSKYSLVRQLREFGMRFVDKQSWLKKQFMKVAIGNLSA